MKIIGTHNGCFHCDEVFAICLLKRLPEFKDSVVVRSRDPDELSECDVVVDVGGVYDPERLRFDHHQKGFTLTWSSFFDTGKWNVKLSSAGLIYVHFGKRVISLMTNRDMDSDALQRIFVKVYESFVLEIDGTDNGVPQSQSSLKYHIRTGLATRIARLNPWWNEERFTSDDHAFQKALLLVDREFSDTVSYFSQCWWPAREVVSRAMKSRASVDSSRTIIVLEQSCPWKSHLFDLEREERAETVAYPQPPQLATYRPEPKFPPKILFVILPREEGDWVVQSVAEENFENRLSFPDSWRSLTDDKLCAATGVDGCIFVHSCGHLGMNKTKEGAIEMAQLVAHDWAAKELELTQAVLPPPVFSRGRGRRHGSAKPDRY
ncbi:Metal-dependent protein hydrolase [Fasciola gigantica]|uniref:Metal-dependent protein hydrolase n=1 Tax=Fasciola gigantica TaxID=46835 RepID=A0A504YVC7_FASGI|nr:Metal-dependent protein hydrolase [Fasciola gigantica]